MSSDSVSLDRKQLATTLDLLAREQRRLRWHPLWFQLHRITVALFVLSLLLAALAWVALEYDWAPTGLPLETAFGGAIFAGVVSFWAIPPLFLINLVFAWKLWRHRRLQRRLRLTPEQRKRIRRSIKKRPVMAVLAFAGALLAISLAILLFLSIADRLDSVATSQIGFRAGDHVITAGLVLVASSFPLLWLMARARDRLREVSFLRTQLADEIADDGPDPEARISIDDYDRLARLEKQRAIEERNRSVRRGIETARNRIYAIQRSLDVQAAIEQLENDTRATVERVIFELMSEPRSRQARPLSDSSLFSIPVPDSSIEILYEPDDANRRVRIHNLQFAHRAAGAGP